LSKQSGLFSLLLLLLAGTAQADTYDVYILAGQSNMDGRGSVSSLSGTLATPQTGQLIYYANPGDGDATVKSNGWQTLAPGFSVSPGTSRSSALPNGTFGPEIGFVDTLTQANPSGNPVAIIKVARGGTNLNSDWSPTGFMYQALLTEVDAAMQALGTGGDTGAIRGMLWHQGESDSADLDHYQDNLETLIGDVRTLVADPLLPFVIGELAQTKSQAFRTLQQTIADENLGVGFASSASLNTPDGTHFDAAGQVVLGQRYAEQIAILTPEPSSLILFGLGGVMLMRRQRTCGSTQ
jgi:iduronate 2-sulfatase